MPVKQKLPISPVKMPACLAGQANGSLERGLLVRTNIPELLMVATAARALNAMKAAVESAFPGYVMRSVGGYRTLYMQWWAFGGKGARYEPCTFAQYMVAAAVGRGKLWPDADRREVATALGIAIPESRWWRKINFGTAETPRYRATAAVPRRSNHGWGLALDIRSIPAVVVAWLCANAWRYGFSAEIQSEVWHWRYFAGDQIPAAVIEYEEGSVTKLVTIEGDTATWGVDGLTLHRLTAESAATFRFVGVPHIGTWTKAWVKNYPCPHGDLGPFTPTDFMQPKAVAA